MRRKGVDEDTVVWVGEMARGLLQERETGDEDAPPSIPFPFPLETLLCFPPLAVSAAAAWDGNDSCWGGEREQNSRKGK